MSIDHEKFKNIAAAIQSIFVVVTFAVGGIWTIYTFDALNARDRAKIELQEIEKKLHQQAVVNVDLEITQAKPVAGNNRFINVIAHIENKGNRSTRLELGERVISVMKLVYDAQGKVKITHVSHHPVLAFADPTQTSLWALPYTIIDQGEIRKFPFLVQVNDPGIYLVGFFAVYTGIEGSNLPLKAGGSAEHMFGISSYEYFIVK